MSLYNLIRNHCKIVRTNTNKLVIECHYCGKSIYNTCFFDWERWNHDMLGTFTILESQITYHLLFKCRRRVKD